MFDEFIILVMVAGALAWFVISRLRMQDVGELHVPGTGVLFGVAAVNTIIVRREPIARDDSLVYLMFTVGGFSQMSSREALQMASWLESACEGSGFFGALKLFEVSSTLEGNRYFVQLTKH